MVRNTVGWLYGELPGLVSQGVLDEPAAARLRGHYGPSPGAGGMQRLLLLFGALGALLIGGGITLLLAHNWEELTRPMRASVAFALLLGAQAVAGWAALRRRNSMAWTEGAGVFLALAVVTALALISQTYHIGGPPENIFLHAVFLTIPVVYLLASRGGLALVWIEMTAWLIAASALSLTEVLQLLLLVAVTAPMAVRIQRTRRAEPRTAIVGWVGAACLTVWALRLVLDVSASLWIPLLTALMACMYGVGSLQDRPQLAGWRRPWKVAGVLGVGVLLVILGFPDVWATMTPWEWQAPALTVSMVVVLLAASLVAFAGLLAIRRLRAAMPEQALLLGVPVVATVCWLLGPVGAGVQAVALAINAYGLATGLLFCVDGLRKGRLGIANGGLLLVMAILCARFLDAEWSFVARGLGFIILGAGFLAVNLWMARSRRRLGEAT